VRLTEDGSELRFEVEDDGRGFDVATVRKGTGLTNLADRLDALGDDFTSTPGLEIN
jgi:signal transduction histidine kinase